MRVGLYKTINQPKYKQWLVLVKHCISLLFEMYRKSKCIKMYQNVLNCIKMYQNVLKLAFIAAYGEAYGAKLASLAF